MGLRVKDEGKSEGRPVIGRIRGATFPGAKASPLPSGRSARERMTPRPEEAKQMTAAQTPAGAASHALVDWHAIDWQPVHQNVRRLQARIVQATKAGRWGKVKALQHL